MAFITKKTKPALTAVLADKAQELSVTEASKRSSADALLDLARSERQDQQKAQADHAAVCKALDILEAAEVEI